MSSLYLVSALAVLAFMSLVFGLALIRKDNSLADIAWSLGFILVAGLTFALRPEPGLRKLLVNSFVLVWGARLSIHIALRNRGRGEDFRYAKWRKSWGRLFLVRTYLQVFLLQGFFLFIISLPVIAVNGGPDRPLGPLDAAGSVVWLLGFVFEAVGDAQLRAFKKRSAGQGRIMRSGLWSLTRHPNYFGEALMWWGIFLIALSSGRGWPTMISPLLITALLRWVSGVPLLEKKYAGNPEFEDYAARTNAFLPWFPKKRRPQRRPS